MGRRYQRGEEEVLYLQLQCREERLQGVRVVGGHRDEGIANDGLVDTGEIGAEGDMKVAPSGRSAA
jgi:hypothetical protein